MMKLTVIILAIISLLFIVGCSTENNLTPLGAPMTLNDLQNAFYEKETGIEYRTYATAITTNSSGVVTTTKATMGTDNINESINLTYETPVQVTYDDISSIVIYKNTSAGTLIPSGNYTIDYENGSITLTSYQKNARVNETMVLTYGIKANFTYRTFGIDSGTVVAITNQTYTSIGSGNYTIDSGAGTAGITLTSYQKTVTNETINCTYENWRPVNYNTTAVSSTPAVVVWSLSNSSLVLSTGNYSFNYDTGSIKCLSTSAYKNANVGINYTYQNASWPANVTYNSFNDTMGANAIYNWSNKISINCTPNELTTGKTPVAIKEIQFLTLGGSKRVQLWKGSYVVSGSSGTSVDVNNTMGNYWYVNNVTGYDTIKMSQLYYDNNQQFALKILDASATNGTGITVNVICTYKAK